ncbi:MAG: YceI family protein [Myxococcales bacterium]
MTRNELRFTRFGQLMMGLSALALGACSEPPAAQEPAPPAPAMATPSANAQPQVEAPTPNAVPAPSAVPAVDAGAHRAATGSAPSSADTATPAAQPTEPTPHAAGTARHPHKAEPSAVPASAPPAPPQAVVSASASYQVEGSGRVSFLIDAPLEKIKGNWSRTGGQLKVDPAKLDQTRGEVSMDLSTLKITTFSDPNQNATQAGHALNWLETGDEVAPEARARFRQAVFRIEKIVSAQPTAFAEGATQCNAVVEGDMTLHGITSHHQVEVSISAEGDPKAPSALRVTSTKPVRLSLKTHDVKPRDLAGRFLAGALEQVGQKISDAVQVSIDFRLVRQ